jgi:hypothetical protein
METERGEIFCESHAQMRGKFLERSDTTLYDEADWTQPCGEWSGWQVVVNTVKPSCHKTGGKFLYHPTDHQHIRQNVVSWSLLNLQIQSQGRLQTERSLEIKTFLNDRTTAVIKKAFFMCPANKQ